jgi:hypothetical protein
MRPSVILVEAWHAAEVLIALLQRFDRLTGGKGGAELRLQRVTGQRSGQTCNA